MHFGSHPGRVDAQLAANYYCVFHSQVRRCRGCMDNEESGFVCLLQH